MLGSKCKAGRCNRPAVRGKTFMSKTYCVRHLMDLIKWDTSRGRKSRPIYLVR